VVSSAAQIRARIPKGRLLAPDVFEERHRILQVLLALHVPFLATFGLWRGYSLVHVLGEAVVVPAALCALASFPTNRRLRSVLVTAGLVWCSSILVHFSGGSIEAHFHFFIMLPFIALYQDWVPFGWAIGFTVLSHGLGSGFGADVIFGHGTAQQKDPWAWAIIHGVAVLFAAAGQVIFWSVTETGEDRAATLAGDLARAQEHNDRRQAVGELLVSLARRNQSLIERQLELIDDLESHERDPGGLAGLFRIDHYATRMRRNAESLIVLSGSDPGRRWAEAIPASEVIRGATAEVEDYTRVDIVVTDDPPISGRAVSDIAHLLAELIENGASFSPPETRVIVVGRGMPNGYLMRVEDHGLGMSDADIETRNALLAAPQEVDLDLSRMLGLHVVSRLAARHGLSVILEHNPAGGICAVVHLPADVLHDPRSATVPTIEMPDELEPISGPAGPGQLAGPGGLARPGHLPGAEGLDLSHRGPGASRMTPAPVLNGGVPSPPAPPSTVGRPEPGFAGAGTGPTPPVRPGARAHSSTDGSDDAAALPAVTGGSDAERRFIGTDPRSPSTTGPEAMPSPSSGAAAQSSARPSPSANGGLARRTPQANLAPGILAAPPAAPAAQRPATHDDPELLRSRLTSYQSGLKEGRESASSSELGDWSAPTGEAPDGAYTAGGDVRNGHGANGPGANGDGPNGHDSARNGER